jgi:hypothetical protein
MWGCEDDLPAPTGIPRFHCRRFWSRAREFCFSPEYICACNRLLQSAGARVPSSSPHPCRSIRLPRTPPLEPAAGRHHGFPPVWPTGHWRMALALHRSTGIMPRARGMMRVWLGGWTSPRSTFRRSIGERLHISNHVLDYV